MYVIIGSHCVPFEGKFLLIALVIIRITLNVIVRPMPINLEGKFLLIALVIVRITLNVR
jgi:hypothetical protein